MINEYGELVEVLMDDKIKVERITSNSNVTDFMISDLDEYVYILEGCSKLLVGEKEIFLKKDTGFLYQKIQNIRLHILVVIVNGYVFF
ncbi:hypothetical protein KX935_07000 [Streptobacillus moniliformis]|nr:hypothetical protein KX935_07000 [Streptobacillus moniliformis]